MATGPEGNLYVHVKIPNFAEGENVFGGVMVLNSNSKSSAGRAAVAAAASQAMLGQRNGVTTEVLH